MYSRAYRPLGFSTGVNCERVYFTQEGEQERALPFSHAATALPSPPSFSKQASPLCNCKEIGWLHGDTALGIVRPFLARPQLPPPSLCTSGSCTIPALPSSRRPLNALCPCFAHSRRLTRSAPAATGRPRPQPPEPRGLAPELSPPLCHRDVTGNHPPPPPPLPKDRAAPLPRGAEGARHSRPRAEPHGRDNDTPTPQPRPFTRAPHRRLRGGI